jgi:uncharacterized protein
MNEKMIEKAELFVKKRLGNDSSGHDWYHLDRVRKLSLTIAEKEQTGDLFIIELAALLHDIPDRKLNESVESGWRVLQNWFLEAELDEQTVKKLTTIINTVSFSSGNTPNTIEGKIVQDADRLDAIGAIGIARAFAYGGKTGQLLYNPAFSQITNNQQVQGSTVAHFYEKLLKLTDMLHTETAKKIAYERHQYMEIFLQQFYKEWNVQI